MCKAHTFTEPLEFPWDEHVSLGGLGHPLEDRDPPTGAAFEAQHLRKPSPTRTVDAAGGGMKIAIFAILVLSGAIHFIAVAKHYPLAPLWAMAGTALLLSAAMFATSSQWWWVVAANALLGVNQGLAWSTTVIMKIDLVGPKRRGLAMGLNESAGYLAVGVAGIVSGFVASRYGLRLGAAYPGLIIAAVGLLLSWFVRETAGYARLESTRRAADDVSRPRTRSLLARSMWSDAALFSVSQAGLINNLNDGLAWGLFPLLFTASGLGVREMSVLAAIYPIAWSLSQLLTGPLSDRVGRKRPIVAGMLLQGVALVSMALWRGFGRWSLGLVALGVGTALVYPTLIAAVGDIALPSWRGVAVGVYRLWRDLGYVAGALLAGVLTDAAGAPVAIVTVGALTALSGIVVAIRFRETHVVAEHSDLSLRRSA